MKHWDIGIVLFHWCLAVTVSSSYVIGSWMPTNIELHIWLGTFIFGLLIFRLIFGFIGDEKSRFSNLLSIFRNRLEFSQFNTTEKFGNPLGNLSKLSMLTGLLIIAISGLFSYSDESDTAGPLYRFVTYDTSHLAGRIHSQFIDPVMFLIATHVIAIIYYEASQKQKLVKYMLIPGYLSKPINLFVSLILALLAVSAIEQVSF